MKIWDNSQKAEYEILHCQLLCWHKQHSRHFFYPPSLSWRCDRDEDKNTFDLFGRFVSFFNDLNDDDDEERSDSSRPIRTNTHLEQEGLLGSERELEQNRDSRVCSMDGFSGLWVWLISYNVSSVISGFVLVWRECCRSLFKTTVMVAYLLQITDR